MLNNLNFDRKKIDNNKLTIFKKESIRNCITVKASKLTNLKTIRFNLFGDTNNNSIFNTGNDLSRTNINCKKNEYIKFLVFTIFIP